MTHQAETKKCIQNWGQDLIESNLLDFLVIDGISCREMTIQVNSSL